MEEWSWPPKHTNSPAQRRDSPAARRRTAQEARGGVVLQHTVAEIAWDIDGVLATFPRGGVYRIQAFEEGPLIGEEAIKKGYFADLKASLPDLEHELHHVHHTPTAVILEAQARGRQQADWRGIPNRGKSIDTITIFTSTSTATSSSTRPSTSTSPPSSASSPDPLASPRRAAARPGYRVAHIRAAPLAAARAERDSEDLSRRP